MNQEWTGHPNCTKATGPTTGESSSRAGTRKELGELSRLYPHKRSLLIDYRQVERFGKAGIALADELLENPGKVLEDVWDAIRNNQLVHTKDGKEPKGINIRFTNLPKKTAIREIRANDINRFISVEGILRKTDGSPAPDRRSGLQVPGRPLHQKDPEVRHVHRARRLRNGRVHVQETGTDPQALHVCRFPETPGAGVS